LVGWERVGISLLHAAFVELSLGCFAGRLARDLAGVGVGWVQVAVGKWHFREVGWGFGRGAEVGWDEKCSVWENWSKFKDTGRRKED
jgi:hypothetical protein